MRERVKTPGRAAPRVTPASQLVDTGGHWWTLVALLDNFISLTH